MSQTKAVVFTARPVTQVHGKSPKRRARHCQHCHELFTPKRATAKYCSDNCRVKAYRAQQKPRSHRSPVILSHCSCAHCGSTFQARSGRGQVYCSASCKTLAYRARRAALIDVVAAITHTSLEIAGESVEKHGMKRATVVLRTLGMVYDCRQKIWLTKSGENKAEN